MTLGPLSFAPGSEHRTFVAVPPGATWAELTVRAAPYATPKLFLIRATQLRPEGSYRSHELRTQVGWVKWPVTGCAVLLWLVYESGDGDGPLHPLLQVAHANVISGLAAP